MSSNAENFGKMNVNCDFVSKSSSQLHSKIPVMSSEAQRVKNSKDSILTSAIMSNDFKCPALTEFQPDGMPSVDVRMAAADSTFFNDTLEESRASSIASINQIAAALRRKSLMAEPRLAIEHLLSIGTLFFN